MTPDKISEGLRLCWEGQEFGQMLMEAGTHPIEVSVGAALKDAFWAMYQVFEDYHRKQQKERANGSN